MKKNRAFYEIIREGSKYNSYIKWYVRTYQSDMILISSFGYRTRKEAEFEVERMICQGKQGFPIGDYLSYTDYTCIGA